MLTPLAWAQYGSAPSHASDPNAATEQAEPSSSVRTNSADAGLSPAQENAEQEPVYRTVVEHERNEDARARRADLARKTPGFASAIDMEQERAAHPGRLPELVARTPAASSRSIGGLGQFSALSLRGSSTQQVRVFVDGVPVDGSFSGMANLSQSSLGELSFAEIYRGYMPIDYGGATMGGALALYSRTHKPGAPLALGASLGLGSFGARSAGAHVGLSLGAKRSLFIALNYSGADGDYPFLDTMGTPFKREDDRERIRSNNGYDRGKVFVSLARRKSSKMPWAAQSFARLTLEALQIPGLARVQSTKARQRLGNVRVHSRQWRSFRAPGSKLSLVGSLARERRRFLDPNGEVGLGRDDELADSADGYLAALLRWPLGKWAYLGAGVDQRIEAVLVDLAKELPDNALLPSAGDATRMRFSTGASLQFEQYLWQDKIVLQPAMRVDFVHSRFEIPKSPGVLSDQGKDHTQWGWSPRLGAKARVLPSLELRGSVGRYFRLPTLMELFGDRGYIVGNEALVAERGLSMDLGFRELLDLVRGGALSLELASAFFASWPRELIMWQRAGPRVRAVNLRSARILGVENEVHLSLWEQRLGLDASYTWMQSRNQSPEPSQRGRSLPGRPAHQLFAKLWVDEARGPKKEARLKLRSFVNYEWISGNFLDPSGRYELPPRSIWGVGAGASYRGFSLEFNLRNLFDKRSAMIEAAALQGPRQYYPAPISDYLGYPLPGRSLWVSLRYEGALQSPSP